MDSLNLRETELLTFSAQPDAKTRTGLALFIVSGAETALYRLPSSTWGSDMGWGGYESVADMAPGQGSDEVSESAFACADM